MDGKAVIMARKRLATSRRESQNSRRGSATLLSTYSNRSCVKVVEGEVKGRK
jgi:hypothetical protein